MGLELAARWSVPLVHTQHSFVTESRAGACAPARLETERRVAAGAHVLVTLSDGELDDVRDLHGHEPGRRVVIPPGVAAERRVTVGPALARRALGVTRPAVLAFVGRLVPHKRPDHAIAAVAALRAGGINVELLIAGGPDSASPSELVRLVRLTSKLQVADAVRFLGQVPAHSLPLVYSAADALLVTSERETFHLSSLESLAAGTPIVGPAVGGIPTLTSCEAAGQVTRRGTGSEPLAYAAAALLNSGPPLRDRLQQAAATFSWEAAADALRYVYQSCVDGVIRSAKRARRAPLPAPSCR